MTETHAVALALLAALLAALAASRCAQPGDRVSTIASENAEVGSRITAEEATLGRERVEPARLQAQRDEFEIYLAIERALREHGSGIPFLQRALRIHSAHGQGRSGPSGDYGPTRPRSGRQSSAFTRFT